MLALLYQLSGMGGLLLGQLRFPPQPVQFPHDHAVAFREAFETFSQFGPFDIRPRGLVCIKGFYTQTLGIFLIILNQNVTIV